MYKNVWEMYGKNISIDFFSMMPPLDSNMMYRKNYRALELSLS